MSWRDTLTQRSVAGVPLMGSFRNARFIVPDAETTVGRRNEVHEYPLRNLPYVEDLGRRAREFSVTVFVDGRLVESGDHLEARDALIVALEAAGPGTFVHPWYGALIVAVKDARVTESTREGGRASFRLTFVEAGEATFPAAGQDTAWKVEDATDTAVAAATIGFADLWSVDGLPDWSVAELETDLYQTLADLEAMVGDVTGPIAALIRTPANMAAAISGSIRRIADIATEPQRAIQLYSRLFGAGDSGASVPATTATRRQQARSSAVLHRYTQQIAVIEACRTSSQTAYVTRDDALTAGTLLLDALDTQMEATDPVTGESISDDLYQSLAALRTTVSNDVRTRGARLPEVMNYTPGTTLPALVLAHQIYGDASRDAEIVARNKVRHPGFVPGGQALEVLSV